MPNLINGIANPASSHTALDTLAWLIDDAFEGDPSQPHMANIHALRDEDWIALPLGGSRSAIVGKLDYNYDKYNHSSPIGSME